VVGVEDCTCSSNSLSVISLSLNIVKKCFRTYETRLQSPLERGEDYCLEPFETYDGEEREGLSLVR
jgi:hypothetical protein